MNHLRACLLALFALFPPLTGNAWDVPSGEYGLDKTHGYITFSYSHLGFSNPHVGFDSFEVTLDADAENPEKSSVDVLIEASSINSRVEVFNEHLNGENFFETASHPEITFASTGISTTGENTFDIAGELTIKGITKPVHTECNHQQGGRASYAWRAHHWRDRNIRGAPLRVGPHGRGANRERRG